MGRRTEAVVLATAPAGLWVRVLAFGFDYLPIAAYLVVLVAAGTAFNRLASSTAATVFGGPVRGEAVGFLLLTAPVLLYFVVSEASARQATWGKRRMGLTVTDAEGRRLTLGRSFARSALKFVPWELAHACIWQVAFAEDQSAPAFAVGFTLVWVLVGANALALVLDPFRRTLYDRLAGTSVRRDGASRSARLAPDQDARSQ